MIYFISNRIRYCTYIQDKHSIYLLIRPTRQINCLWNDDSILLQGYTLLHHLQYKQTTVRGSVRRITVKSVALETTKRMFSINSQAPSCLLYTSFIIKMTLFLLPGNKNKVILIIKYKYLQQEKNFQFSKFKYIVIKQWVLHCGCLLYTSHTDIYFHIP